MITFLKLTLWSGRASSRYTILNRINSDVMRNIKELDEKKIINRTLYLGINKIL